MRYYSTRDTSRSLFSLREAAFAGLAPDWGLFVPESIPQVDMRVVESLADVSFAEMAAYLAGAIFDDLDSDLVRRCVFSAFDFPVSLHRFDDRLFSLELFHGPTFAFKDFGARFMGRMIGELRGNSLAGAGDVWEKDCDSGALDGDVREKVGGFESGAGGSRKLIVLTATSGDTGSAVAQGFYGVDGVEVVVLYPDGKVSPLQEAQMTTLGGNIHPLRVRGNFDDCQRMVKDVFCDTDLRREVLLTSANSINLLRWIPQSFYYFYGYCMWKKATGGDAPEIVVPSGNYGNITAGILAHKMGMPVRRFIAASNSNDVVPRFLSSGEYCPRPSLQTLSNAMDVGAPSNFERLMWLYDGAFSELCAEVSGFSLGDAGVLRSIRSLYDRYGYFSDPHSAIGYAAALSFDIDGFWVSTADAAKFSSVLLSAVGSLPPLPEGLRSRLDGEKRYCFMSASALDLKRYLLSEL